MGKNLYGFWGVSVQAPLFPQGSMVRIVLITLPVMPDRVAGKSCQINFSMIDFPSSEQLSTTTLLSSGNFVKLKHEIVLFLQKGCGGALSSIVTYPQQLLPPFLPRIRWYNLDEMHLLCCCPADWYRKDGLCLESTCYMQDRFLQKSSTSNDPKTIIRRKGMHAHDHCRINSKFECDLHLN